MQKHTRSIPNDNGNRIVLYLRSTQSDSKSQIRLDNERKKLNDLLHDCPDMELTGIYCDTGCSANSSDRLEFNRMIADCKAGKIDLIITPNTSSFYRNIVDCISCIKMLRELDHPVGVYFETENLYTLNPESNMQLSFIAALDKEESRMRSTIMKRSYVRRRKHEGK